MKKSWFFIPMEVLSPIVGIEPQILNFAGMRNQILLSVMAISLLAACYRPERNCEQFKNGSYSFTSSVDGVEMTTTFFRKDGLEIDYFNGKADSASVRWINDCEYIVKKLNPKNKAEEKSVQIKILSTTDNSYTFEYGLVGSSKKSRGTAFKTN